MVITKSWSRILIHLRTPQSESKSISASIFHEASVGYRLLYQYNNKPNADEIDLSNHSGSSELLLLSSCLECYRLLHGNPALRDSINIPDGHRKVFALGHATARGLGHLVAELESLSNDVLRENQRSFRKLAEARLEYWEFIANKAVKKDVIDFAGEPPLLPFL